MTQTRVSSTREKAGEPTTGLDLDPYPTYYETPIRWLSEIPSSWETVRLKFLVSKPITSGVGESGDRDDPDWPRYIRITDIAGPRELRGDTYKSLPPDVARKAPVEVGDLLLAAVGATYGKSYLHTVDIGPACYAGYLVRVSPASDVDPRFLAYWTESGPYWAEVRSQVVQATVQNFSAGRYKELQVPTPPSDQQTVIADFLDKKTARIDDLIAKKERLIELLEEKRTALITQAVTKGLDLDVPMKDSGVEWLGEIPEHWSTTKIRHLSSVQRGASPRPISDERYFDENGEYGWVRIRDVTSSGMYLQSTEQTLSQLGKNRSVPLGPGRVILSIAATVGEPVITDIKCCIHDGFVYFENLSLAPEFLYFILKSHGVYSGLGKLGTQLNLNTDTVGDIRVPVPGLDEQRLIVAHLKNTRQIYMAALNRLDQAARLLDEYRSALITAAVTGKIDVRDHAA